jgi:hypothetical protein
VHNCCETQNFWDIFSVLFGEESVLVKNVVKQAKKYQEKLGELGKKEDMENDDWLKFENWPLEIYISEFSSIIPISIQLATIKIKINHSQ